jgi:hypothetical protein
MLSFEYQNQAVTPKVLLKKVREYLRGQDQGGRVRSIMRFLVNPSSLDQLFVPPQYLVGRIDVVPF